jgi:DNA invertase Pin-like site-specific DNA recombinase
VEQLPVAGYFRVSHARDGMKAPELYQHDIERYCRYRGFVIGEVFSDIDFSAFRGARPRPSLELLKQRRREFSAVIVPKLSRFGRSVKDLATLFDLFEDDGVTLVFLDIGLDTSTSQGRLLRNVMSSFAEYESDVRADYFRAAAANRARRGLPSGGWIPYGYRRARHGYRIVSLEAQVVRGIFEAHAAGDSMTAIARRLNAQGVPSPKNVLWSKPTVRKFLDNHHYAALLSYEGELRAGAWPAIVSSELWTQVQQRRRSVSNRGVHAPSGLYLLSGLITCGVCGSTLHHRTKQDRVPGQYVCRGTERRGYCRGGGIAEHRAEEQVAGAYLDRYGLTFVHDPTAWLAPSSVISYWSDASVEGRRALLASVLEDVVLVPRADDNPRGVGERRGRILSISFKPDHPKPEPSVAASAIGAGEGAARVCAGCGRRKHLSNFRRDDSGPGGRSARCPRCRKAPVAVPPPAEGRPSYQEEWRRFREAFRSSV